MTDIVLQSDSTLQSSLDEYWSQRAASYDADQHRPERLEDDRRVWSRVWSAALPAAPAEVVDLGTGSGYVAWLLHDLGYEVTGVDSAPGMIARARSHRGSREGAPRFVLGDAVEPPCPDGSADAVTARYVLWTMRDPVGALRAWRRLLRPGGTLAIVDGLWFPDGLPSGSPGASRVDGQPPAPAGSDDWRPEDVSDRFARAYAARLPGELPLAAAGSIEESAAALAEAGFADVRLTPLTEVFELDVRHGVARGHDVTMQYLLRGTAP